MITIRTNQSGFEYDIHSLVKSFYPAMDVAFEGEKKFLEEPPLFHIEIIFSDKEVEAAFYHVMGQENSISIGLFDIDYSCRIE